MHDGSAEIEWPVVLAAMRIPSQECMGRRIDSPWRSKGNRVCLFYAYPYGSLLAEYGSRADEVVNLEGHWILPGLINTHVHTSQQLGRGIADDVDLLTWLDERIWPYESNMSEEDSYISTLLCGIELIHSGVTCFAEAGGQHVSAMAKAVEELGIRACLARSTMDTGEGLPAVCAQETTDTCIKVDSRGPLYPV
ncbi:hypothetical protein R1flu_004443 [Riccia fluitans]|uniref:Amidohydrolase-related domain-containing protein n=1 Tax=Riccia fluitans TaxID=41844 RepID=A0ABD1YT82_9MARC